MTIVDLEAHVVTRDVVKAWQEFDPAFQDLTLKPSSAEDGGRRLLDIEHERLTAVADSGVDVGVSSLTAPGLHNLKSREAVG